jgi:hypothetical protein
MMSFSASPFAQASQGAATPTSAAFLDWLDAHRSEFPNTPEVDALLQWITANMPGASTDGPSAGSSGASAPGSIMSPAPAVVEAPAATDDGPALTATSSTNDFLTADPFVNFVAPGMPGGSGASGDPTSVAAGHTWSNQAPMPFDDDVSLPLTQAHAGLDDSFFGYDWSWFDSDVGLHKPAADWFVV